MVVCKNCGNSVAEGKFCEKCGAPLPEPVAEGSLLTKGADSIDKIWSSVNKAASDFLAIKSDFSDNVLICKAKKTPGMQEKKVKVEDIEVLYYYNGTGFVKHQQTFITKDQSFICFYVKKDTTVHNSIVLNIKSPIKNLNENDLISVNIVFDLILTPFDLDEFFKAFMVIKLDTWSEIDINSTLFMAINGKVNNNVVSMIKNDGNIDLRDVKGQISKFNDDILSLIKDEVKRYGLEVNSFSIKSVDTDIQEINKILIDNLYK